MNRALLVAVWLILAISAQATDGAYRFNVYMFDRCTGRLERVK